MGDDVNVHELGKQTILNDSHSHDMEDTSNAQLFTVQCLSDACFI